MALLAGDSDFLLEVAAPVPFFRVFDCLTGDAEDFLETVVAAFLRAALAFESEAFEFLTGETLLLLITTSAAALAEDLTGDLDRDLPEAAAADCFLLLFRLAAEDDLTSLSAAALLEESPPRPSGMAKPSPSLAGELGLYSVCLMKALKIALSWFDS